MFVSLYVRTPPVQLHRHLCTRKYAICYSYYHLQVLCMLTLARPENRIL